MYQPEYQKRSIVSGPLRARTLDFDASYINVWGYGENVYLGLFVRGYPDATPCLIKTNSNGFLETLLTNAEAWALLPATSPGGAAQHFGEIVAVLEAPDGTIFCSTHSPASILRKKRGQAWEDVLDTDFMTIYGMGANGLGQLFFTGRHGAGYPTPADLARRSVYRSINGGDTWAEVYTEAADWIYGIAFNYQFGIVVGCRNGMLYSNDGGATFNLVALAGAGTLRSPILLRDSTFLIGSENVGSPIYMSADRGVTWELLANIFASRLAYGFNNLSVSGGVILGSTHRFGWCMLSPDEGATWQMVGPLFHGLYSRGCYLNGRTAFVGGIVEVTNPYYGENYVGKLAIIDLSELVPPQPQPFEMISIATLAHDTTSDLIDCAPLKCNDKSVAITVEVTYDGAAAAGIECYVYSSFDKTDYDTTNDEFATIIPSFTAGGTLRRTEIINPSARFIKVRVKNLDGAQDATDIKVTATMRG